MKDDDIEAIIDAAKHFKYHEPSGTTPFNRISKLPESKRHMKMAIKERIRLLVASYISLASFIDDDLVDFLEYGDTKNHKRKVIRIYNKVFREFEKLRKEISQFDPFEVPKE
ncbi:MAG TPA: hypothetical protein VHE10_00915 [Candidatus Paceibacterota bacterium]|nr:hypothetical protein [Candidatus Paceibacterota bacterium]